MFQQSKDRGFRRHLLPFQNCSFPAPSSVIFQEYSPMSLSRANADPTARQVGTAALITLGTAAAGLRYAVKGACSRVFGPSVCTGPGIRRTLALTFDDGPSPGTLDLLGLPGGTTGPCHVLLMRREHRASSGDHARCSQSGTRDRQITASPIVDSARAWDGSRTSYRGRMSSPGSQKLRTFYSEEAYNHSCCTRRTVCVGSVYEKCKNEWICSV